MLKKISLKSILKITAILSVILIIFSLYHYFEINKLATKENIELYLKPFGPWLPIVWLCIFIIGMIFYIPASVFLITIGTLLGPIWGSFWGIIGCYMASLIIFFAARK